MAFNRVLGIGFFMEQKLISSCWSIQGQGNDTCASWLEHTIESSLLLLHSHGNRAERGNTVGAKKSVLASVSPNEGTDHMT